MRHSTLLSMTDKYTGPTNLILLHLDIETAWPEGEGENGAR